MGAPFGRASDKLNGLGVDAGEGGVPVGDGDQSISRTSIIREGVPRSAHPDVVSRTANNRCG
jgi:hypothetical protein